MNLQNQPSKHYLNYKLKPISLVVISIFAQQAYAQDANTVEAITGEKSNTTKPIDIPSVAMQYGATKKTLLAAEVKETKQAGTGKVDSQGKPVANKPVEVNIKAVQVRAKRFHEIGPMPGLGLTKEEIPGNVQSITAKEIKESHALSLTELMNTHLQSVNVNDYQSNPFQMDVTYRGFTASPQLGTAQGLSVFLDGIRVNEPFGDVVNWDMIPLNAINGLDVFPGSNPIFGLGTLGGALSMRTKSGFDAQEGTLEALGGSFNRKQFQGSVGGNNGVIAGFVAANIFNEDGWRDNSPSKVNQVFGKAEWRNDKLQLGLSGLYAGNDLIGNGLLPTETIQQDPSKVFTSPDETKNRLLQFQLSGIWDVTDKFNITAQVYRRNSKRHASNGDVNSDFAGTATRKPLPGEYIGNGFLDDGTGLPVMDGYVNNIAIAQDSFGNGHLVDVNGNLDNTCDVPDCTSFTPNPFFDGNNLLVGTNANQAATYVNSAGVVTAINPAKSPEGDIVWTSPRFTLFTPPTPQAQLPERSAAYIAYQRELWAIRQQFGGVVLPPSLDGSINGVARHLYDVINDDNLAGNYIAVDSGFLVNIQATPILYGTMLGAADVRSRLEKMLILQKLDENGFTHNRDGAFDNNGALGIGAGQGTGDPEGTPNALITTTDINQVSDGGAVQFNWNLDKHKLMVGASVDKAQSTYNSGQMLAVLDANHNVHLDSNFIGDELAAKDQSIGLNDFDGESITKSIYASETWSPIETLHLNASARYNHTNIRNTLAVNNNAGFIGPSSYLNYWAGSFLCPTADTCPLNEIIPFSLAEQKDLGKLGPPETERFSYHSFNPAFGATWQANSNLNLYGNWSQGARTPSVIELGCAFDNTPIDMNRFYPGQPPKLVARTLAERRFCTLPSTLSGDPYLPQIVARTTEFGARGKLAENIEWNASVYRSNLQDDIYFVSFTPERSFFQTIGKTRRQGLEMGLKGTSGKASFMLNYSLTDATFQDSFRMTSPNNSSAGTYVVGGTNTLERIGQINVRPGDRMPGIPLQNLSASVAYDVTHNWKIGLSTVVHGGAFVRGNENNQHQAGQSSTQYYSYIDPTTGQYVYATRQMPDFRFPGRTPGYAVFNFQTSYKLSKEWMLGLQVNNIFDRTYYSAGRLGQTPFSPQINGAIDPVSKFNYNSNDWLGSTFLAPGAPRAAWLSLTYDFDLGK